MNPNERDIIRQSIEAQARYIEALATGSPDDITSSRILWIQSFRLLRTIEVDAPPVERIALREEELAHALGVSPDLLRRRRAKGVFREGEHFVGPSGDKGQVTPLYLTSALPKILTALSGKRTAEPAT